MKHIQTQITKILTEGYNTEEKVNLRGEVFTPFELINEMLDQFPKDIWTDPNKTWLDPCAGIGNFHAVVLERLMKRLKDWEPNEELRYKHIVEEQLFFIEINPESCDIIEELFNPDKKYKLNLKCCDALKLPIKDMTKEDWKDSDRTNIDYTPFGQFIRSSSQHNPQ